ncbi:uncharacterized protein B0H64DRAFT_113059 [Chaetomium fimeti]|uniref:DNA (cytosine-5)-methyltransferase 1 replication foci domain-containing protein n=1 Tax=Chaetomium fimeti TaxID=1854472 RepID=A0AAE0HIM6_9PEZI|nr:hypothetical protein B0H64DRAFT_113059 [Chaetomium fimeti]
MAGRPRRRRASSTSTTAELDRAQIRWAKESSVLRPTPRDMPDNDWPCYVLTDATIYRKDGRTVANPLLVHVQGSLIVRGLLEVDEDKLVPNLVRSSVKTAYIEIPHSDRYSIGDGPLVLWVSGAAGWFEIRPSIGYQKMYDQVREAITLYYSAFEIYEAYFEACASKKKARRPRAPSLDDIFLKYAVRAGDGILRHEVEALCSKWAEFLIPHFDKEFDLDWNATHFAKWLRSSHPEVQKKLADIANGLVPPLPPPEPQESVDNKATQSRRSRSARASSRNSEVQDNPPSLPIPQAKPTNNPRVRISETPIPLPGRYRQLTQPASSEPSPIPVEAPKVDTPKVAPKADTPKETPMSDADSETPVDRLLGALDEVATEVNINKVPPSKINSSVFFKCKIRNYMDAKDIIAYYAKELLPRLPAEWKDVPWYHWLVDVANQPWAPSTEHTEPDKIPAQTFRRMKMGPKAGSSTKSATQLPPPINLKLRAKSAVQDESESEEEIAELYTAPQRNRRSGKGATLRLATSAKKRPRSELDDQPSGSRRGRKSTKTSHYISDDDESEDADNASDEDVTTSEETVLGSRLPLPEGAVRIAVHAERLPTTSPSGPDGTWTCDEEGCTYVVRSADEQDAQELIQAHFRDHEAQAEKINLAVTESRGHMPIKYVYFPPVLLLVYMHSPGAGQV